MQRDFKGVWIPKEIWLNENLTALEKVIFAEISSLDADEGCWASNQYFAEFCKCSERKVTETITKLKDLGLVRYEKFDGRTRILRVAENSIESSRKCEAEQKNLLSNNIDNNINSNIETNNTKVLLVDEQNDCSNDFLGSAKQSKSKGLSLYKKCAGMIDDFTTNTELRELLVTYLKFRLEVRDKPIYANQWKGMLNKLDREFSSTEEKCATIQQSIDRGYLSFYPVKIVKNYSKSDNVHDRLNESGEKYVPKVSDNEHREIRGQIERGELERF